MTNRNNLVSRLNKVNKQLNKLKGNNNGLSFSKISNKMFNSKLSYPSNSSNKVFIAIGVILLLIVIAICGYFLYQYFNNKKETQKSKLLIPYIHDAQLDKMFTSGSIPATVSGNEYNINMWLYINDYQYRNEEDKCIIFKGPISSIQSVNDIENVINNESNPSVWFKKHVNTLVVLTGLDTNFSTECDKIQECGKGGIANDKCEIEDFPIQRWVNLNISLRNNVLDIFMDGSLVKSCILSGSPTTNNGDLFVGKKGNDSMTGFNGYISKLEYTNKALSVDDINKRYKNGPTVNIGSGLF